MSMTSMWEILREAGPVAWLIVPGGLLGALGAVVALILGVFCPRGAFRLGALVAGAGILCAGLGGAGVAQVRLATDRGIAAAEASPVRAEKIRRGGYRDARSAAGLGLIFAALPLLAGLTAMFVGRRRWDAIAAPDEADVGAPGVRVPVAVAALGVISSGFALSALSAPLPGRNIPLDENAWTFLDTVEAVQRAATTDRTQLACIRLELDLVNEPRRSPPELPAVARKCVDARVAAAVLQPSLGQVRRALEAARWSALVRRFPELGSVVQADLDEVDQMIDAVQGRPSELPQL